MELLEKILIKASVCVKSILTARITHKCDNQIVLELRLINWTLSTMFYMKSGCFYGAVLFFLADKFNQIVL